MRENAAQQKFRTYISEKALFMQSNPDSSSMATCCSKLVNTIFIGMDLYPLFENTSTVMIPTVLPRLVSDAKAP